MRIHKKEVPIVRHRAVSVVMVVTFAMSMAIVMLVKREGEVFASLLFIQEFSPFDENDKGDECAEDEVDPRYSITYRKPRNNYRYR